jgi:hypothetical protein
MAYYMECLLKSHLFWIVVMVLSFLLLIFIAIIIKNYFDVYKLTLLIYAIYFPIGAFMGGYYLITTKEWFPRENSFTLCFLYNTLMTAILILGTFLSNYAIRNEYKISNSIKKSFWGYQYTREYIESKTEVVTFLALYSNIFICIYTIIGFCKLVMEWAKLYLL